MATVASPLAVLNRILIRLHRSLPQYLGEAWPWTHRGDEDAFNLVQIIIHEQQELTRRIAEFIGERGGTVRPGTYPEQYTDLNFLALDYMLLELLKYQRQFVRELETDAALLASDPEAAALAQEVVEVCRSHLGQLEELVGEAARSS